MDEYNSNKEKLYLLNASKDNTWMEGSACGASMGGDIPGNHLLTYLEMSINSAESIDIIVSFLMESGVRLLLPALKSALDRGVNIRLLTGNYLGITQPSALTLLKYELDDRICIHLYREKNRSFHPKAYIFHYADDSEIYVVHPIYPAVLLREALNGTIDSPERRMNKIITGFIRSLRTFFAVVPLR